MKQKTKILAAFAVASTLIFAACSNSEESDDRTKNEALSPESSDGGFGPNLVVNPSNEDGKNGWGYEGSWYVGKGSGYGGDWQRPRSGESIASSSYTLGTRNQRVSLSSESDEYLDTSPEITVSTWFNGRCGGRFFMRAQLLDGSGVVIDTKNVGSENSLKNVHLSDWTDQSWVQHSVSFTGYPAGVRSVLYTDGGKDGCWWAGFYGGQMDDTEVRVKANVATTSVAPETPAEVTTTTVAVDTPIEITAPPEIVVDPTATDYSCTSECVKGIAVAAGLPDGVVSVSVDGGAPVVLTGENAVALTSGSSKLEFSVAANGTTKSIASGVKRSAGAKQTDIPAATSDTTVAPAEESDTTIAAVTDTETETETSDDSSGSSPILWIIIALIVIAVIAYLVRRSQASKA
jgi:hypothetical protein